MTTDEGVRQQHAAPPVDAFPIDDVRLRFPAIARAGRFIFFDNAAGAQVPSPVVDAVTDHLLARNVQRGGPYRHSREVDAMIARARTRVATFVNARGADEIAFGLNATSFIRAISLAVGQTLAARPEVVVSELDHEANVATWLALERVGARIVWWRVRDSNRRPTFREDFIPDVTPDKLEAGTYAYENVAGMEAAIEYLERLGSGSIGAAMALVAEYERTLSSAMLDALQGIPGVTVHGVTHR